MNIISISKDRRQNMKFYCFLFARIKVYIKRMDLKREYNYILSSAHSGLSIFCFESHSVLIIFFVEPHSEFSPFGVESLSVLSLFYVESHSEFSQFWVQSILSSVHSRLSLFGVDSIRGSVPFGVQSHSGFSLILGSVPFGVQSHSGLGPFGVQSHSGFSPIWCWVHSDRSPVLGSVGESPHLNCPSHLWSHIKHVRNNKSDPAGLCFYTPR